MISQNAWKFDSFMTRHVFVITESKKMDGWASGFTFRPFSNEYKNEDSKKQIQSSFMKILSSMFDISETSWVWAWMQWWVVSDSQCQWHCGNASLARQWVARCTCHHISGTRGQDTQTRHSVLSGLNLMSQASHPRIFTKIRKMKDYKSCSQDGWTICWVPDPQCPDPLFISPMWNPHYSWLASNPGRSRSHILQPSPRGCWDRKDRKLCIVHCNCISQYLYSFLRRQRLWF